MSVQSVGMLHMSMCERKKSWLVPLMIVGHPCAKQWSSLCNCLLRDRVHDAIAVFSDFDDGTCILIVSKTMEGL